MQLKPRHYAMILLMLATALLHLGAAFDAQLFPGHQLPDPLFALNGLGYLGLLLAYFVPTRVLQARRRLVWWVLVAYIIVTIVAWVVIWVGFNVIRDGVPFFSRDSYYGVPAKIAEVLLLILLRRDKP